MAEEVIRKRKRILFKKLIPIKPIPPPRSSIKKYVPTLKTGGIKVKNIIEVTNAKDDLIKLYNPEIQSMMLEMMLEINLFQKEKVNVVKNELLKDL